MKVKVTCWIISGGVTWRWLWRLRRRRLSGTSSSRVRQRRVWRLRRKWIASTSFSWLRGGGFGGFGGSSSQAQAQSQSINIGGKKIESFHKTLLQFIPALGGGIGGPGFYGGGPGYYGGGPGFYGGGPGGFGHRGRGGFYGGEHFDRWGYFGGGPNFYRRGIWKVKAIIHAASSRSFAGRGRGGFRRRGGHRPHFHGDYDYY